MTAEGRKVHKGALRISFYYPSHYNLSVEDAPANTYSCRTSWAGTKSRFKFKRLRGILKGFRLEVVMLCLQLVCFFADPSFFRFILSVHNHLVAPQIAVLFFARY